MVAEQRTANSDDECAAWWAKLDPVERAKAAYDLALRGDKDNSNRRERCRRDCSAYEGLQLTSFGAYGYSAAEFTADLGKDDKGNAVPVLINIAKAIVQTMTSKIAVLSKPKTKVVTTYGSWKDRRAAIQIDRLIEADFQSSQGWLYPTLWQMGEHGFKLAHAATGTVGIKVSEYPNSSKVHYQLLDMLDVFFDLDELTYGQPLTMGTSTWWNPYELAKFFPDWEVDILNSCEDPPEGLTPVEGEGKRARMVRLVEVWKLAIGKEPGRYIACIKGGINLTDPDDEEYPYDSFPIATYHADKNLTGPWSQSTTGIMFEALKMLNECVLSMKTAETHTAKTLLIHDPKQLNSQQVNETRDFMSLELATENDTTVSNAPVQFIAPAPFDRMNIEWVNWLIQMIHDMTGMSESATQGTREKGITSAEGQRAVAAIGAERFAQSSSDYIQWLAVDVAKLALRSMKRIHERDGSFTRNWVRSSKGNTSAKFLRQVSSEVLAGLDENNYVLQAAPVGAERNTPAERSQRAVEAVQYGIIQPDRLPALLEHLDTPGEVSGLDAQREWVENEIDRWLYSPPEELEEPDFYHSPLPQMNLEDATLQVLDAFWRSDIELANDKEEDHRLDFFGQFITELDALAKQKAQFQLEQEAAAQPQQAQPAA
jgi:hypothetical protein